MADKFVRASGQLVTPKDDSKIYNHIFGTGLFSLPTITYSGTTLHVTAFDGIVQGHDFHFDEQDVAATLGSTTSAATLYLYADFNLLASPILSLKTAFSVPSYPDDLNASGTHQTMLLASYTATLSAVTGVTVSSSINLMQTSVAEKLAQLYPIGSIYLSVNDTNPGTFIGGTWERIKDRFLLAAGDTYSAGSTGGEAMHTLSLNEMPSHSHIERLGDGSDPQNVSYLKRKVSNGKENGSSIEVTWRPSGLKGDITTTSNGGSDAHNNMPPYLAVYMWVRTA